MIILQKKKLSAKLKLREPIHTPQPLQPDMNRLKEFKKKKKKLREKRQEKGRAVTSYSAGAGGEERGRRRRRREEAIEGRDRRL